MYRNKLIMRDLNTSPSKRQGKWTKIFNYVEDLNNVTSKVNL